ADNGLICLAQSDSRLCQRIEHRLQVKSGAADNLEHVGGRGLLLQRLAQLVEQARVLDRDRRLISEGLEQRDLLVGKRINFGTAKLNCSDRQPLAKQWNTGRRPVPQPFRERASFGIFLRLSLEVDYVDRTTLENCPASAIPTRAQETYTNLLRNRSPGGDRTEFLPVKLENSHVIGVAKARRAFDHSLQHRPEVSRRGADDS